MRLGKLVRLALPDCEFTKQCNKTFFDIHKNPSGLEASQAFRGLLRYEAGAISQERSLAKEGKYIYDR